MVQGQIGFRIFQQERRLADELVHQYAQFSACVIGDAMGRFRVLDSRIRPVVPTRRIVGRAVTVLTRGIDNLMMHKAMEMAGPGDVIIVDTYGETNASGWGGLMTHTAVKTGLEGVVIDGSVRDLEDLRQLDFPVYARAVTARGCFKDGPGEINCPISCGGVAVMPGDLILADEDGVVCVPFDDVEVVLERARIQLENEKKRGTEIEAGELFKRSINELLEKKGVL